MAKFHPPESFCFEKPAEWPDWKKRFSRFRTATKLDKEDGPVQVSTLVYALGKEAENILSSFSYEDEEDESDYDVVLAKFDAYFIPRRNVIHERACFNQRVQRPGERAETFIRSLYELSEHCDFGTTREEHIRDRIVVGILDKTLSQRLQLIPSLTLDKTVQEVRQSEEVKAQVDQQGERACAIQEVAQRHSSGGGARTKWRRPQRDKPRDRDGDSEHRKCGRCGKTQHSQQDKCPARKSTCNRCGKSGHWERVCKSRLVSEVTEAEGQGQYFLGSVDSTPYDDDDWTVSLNIGSSEPINFKIDTGADCCIISETVFKTLQPKRVLHTAKKVLSGPGGGLNCLGQFITQASYKGQTYTFRLYVIRGASVNSLLSRPVALAMGLVRRVYEISSDQEFGLLKTQPVKIVLQEDAQPYAVCTARRVPIPLLSAVKEELERMVANDIIETVTEPTEWCAAMVPVPKKSGKARICVDLKKLNKAVKRERLILPTAEEMTAKLGGSTVFSSLDAASGFWQIPLDKDSQRLTTFITPFGRYCFKRLPFGITSAPEIFQRKMLETLEGLQGVAVYMDDIIVHGGDMKEHDERLQKVMERLESAGLKLNTEKCVLRKGELHFLGQVINRDGVRCDPAKVSAINELDPPENVHELKRALGMVNYLGKYVPDLATVGQPMYELLKSDSVWMWGPAQQSAFEKIKELLTTSPTLVYYDVHKPTMVSADASSYGIGGVLLQLHGEDWRPVAYCSRRLTDAETRYAQIEKECLASVWACERFEMYLYGLPAFKLITDHKPLIPLMNSRDLDNVPIRCQRLLMRLMRFNLEAEFAPGKTLVVADMLSRSPQRGTEHNRDSHTDVECYVAAVISSVPASPRKMDMIRAETAADEQLQEVIRYIQKGWPEHIAHTHSCVREYFPVRNELSVHDGLVVRGSRIVIPEKMRSDTLERIHEGHQGLSKCRDRANTSVWWPGIASQITHRVENCMYCREQRRAQSREPLLSTPLPDRPWLKIGIDLCEHEKENFLVIADYYSRYLEILHMPTTTSTQVALKLRATFARFGIPEEVVSDNGPQFSSEAFRDLAREMDFKHTTSSPHNPQGNGHAERAVQTAKRILRQEDPLLALMIYRSSPHSSTGVSPAELLMGRKIRTTLPILAKNLQPKWPSRLHIRAKDAVEKSKQAYYYNRRHGVRQLTPLQRGDHVLTRLDNQKAWTAPAVVAGESTTQRSYLIETEQGALLRRNRRHLQAVPVAGPPVEANTNPGHDPPDVRASPKHSSPGPRVNSDGLFQTRSGRSIKPIQRLDL